MKFSKYQLATFGIIAIIFVWASSFTITRLVVQQVPPFTMAFIRFFIATIILYGLYLANRKKIQTNGKKPWLSIFFMALCGVTLYYVFFNLSMYYTSASTGALIQGFIPVIIAILAAMFLKEKLSNKQMLGVFLSVLGVIFIGFISASTTPTKNPLLGNALMMGSVIAWAIYTILSKTTAHIHPLWVTAHCGLIGTTLLFPFAVWEWQHQQIHQISGANWAAIIYLGAIASGVSYLVYNNALSTLSAVHVGNLLNLDPVIGTIIAMIVLHEKISVWQILGGILVLIGIWLSAEKRTKAETPIAAST